MAVDRMGRRHLPFRHRLGSEDDRDVVLGLAKEFERRLASDGFRDGAEYFDSDALVLQEVERIRGGLIDPADDHCFARRCCEALFP